MAEKSEKIILPKFFVTPKNTQIKLQEKLSKREQLCITYLTHGYTAIETGQALHLSQRTVEKYIANIKEKLCCKTKIQLRDMFFNSDMRYKTTAK